MADNDVEEYFIDMVSNVSHANGVFRLTLAQQDVENTTRPVVKVLIPATQLQAFLRSITNAANEIREKVQAQTGTKSGTAAEIGEPAVATPDTPPSRSRKKK